MVENGAEYESEDELDAQEFLQALTYGVLVVAGVVWVIVGVRDRNPVVASVWLVVGGFAAFMLARLWFGGAPVVET